MRGLRLLWTRSSKTPTSRKRSVWRNRKLKKEDPFLRRRQMACMIYDWFRVTGVNESVLAYADLFTVVLRNDDIQQFGPEIRNPIVVHLSIKPLHFCHHSSSVFAGLMFNLPVRKSTLITEFTSWFCSIKLTLRKMPKITRWPRALTFDVISGRLSRQLPRWTPASETLSSRCTSTICGSEGGAKFGIDFAR